MKSLEDKCLEFVLRYYKPNRLDTQKAYQHFVRERNLSAISYRCLSFSVLRVVAVFATIFISAGTYFYLKPSDKWIEVASMNQVLEYMLPDSTFVTLAPYTTLRYNSVSYKEENRAVEVIGKAFFYVRRDVDHPFIVKDDIAQVKVLGTQFLVNALPMQTEVYVESGKVLFTAKGNAEGVVLTNGMYAILNAEETSPHILKTPTANQMTWKTGLFVYDNTPLTDVLQELSLYYHINLSTVSNEKRLSGRFPAQSLDEIIDVIERVLNVQIKQK